MTISVPAQSIYDGPTVMWNHVDGPLLKWAGQMHWLTWGERWRLFVGRTTIDKIAEGRWPYLAKMREQLRAEEPKS